MTNILVVDFIAVLLIFLRIVAAFMTVPVFSHNAVPVIARIVLAWILAYLVFLALGSHPVQFEITMWSLFFNAFKEIITGLIIGFMLNMIFYGVSFAGSLIGFEMELAMADVLDPSNGMENNIIGEALYILAILIFLLINGHHYVISGLVYSFKVIPLGKFTVTKPLFDLIVTYSALVFILAVKIAAPFLVSFFLVSIAEGILARIIPQLQVFFVAQPLMIGLGLLLLAGLIPVYVTVIKNLLQNYEKSLISIVNAMSV